MDHPVERFADLPDLLHPELPDLRLAVLGEVELRDRDAREVAPVAVGQHGHFRLDVGAGLEVAKWLAVLAATLVTLAHAEPRRRLRRSADSRQSRSARSPRPPPRPAAGSGPAPRPRSPRCRGS